MHALPFALQMSVMQMLSHVDVRHVSRAEVLAAVAEAQAAADGIEMPE